MSQRRLRALGYLDWDKVNANNDEHIRKIVVWLEDQKIRQYPIEDRKKLRDTKNDNWVNVFRQYCRDVNCPINDNDKLGQLEWLLGHALWLEIGTNHDKYTNVAETKSKSKKDSVAPTLKSTNPLDKLDFDDPKFIGGTNSLATLLKVPKHSDHLVTLEAVCKLVKNRLNEENLRNPVIHRGKAFPALETQCGFSLKDQKLEKAARALALLHIQDLRDLQTKINESIVAVQSVTANPKTDTRLGKVGK